MADIRHTIQISAPAESVRRSVSTAAGLTEWWASDVTETDGAVDLGFFNRQTIYRLKLQRNDPDRIEWLCESGKEWAGTRLIFTLDQKDGASTSVRLTHAGWASDTDYFVSCTTTWGELMFRLKAAAEGKSRGPLFLPGSLAY
ncbi:MAG TPA: SRPBCC domain-containing protein [Bryobacteraceae bacterium]|nr:SRPBCC domain-containing protein [Bryobacteraceae bacterium]